MMAEYIDIDDLVVVTDTRGTEHETTVRHIFEMNKGVYTAADVVERKHGKWIGIPRKTVSKRNRTIHSMVYICSLCRHSNGRHKSNFCPNCGAKMKKDPFNDNPPMEYFESGGK